MVRKILIVLLIVFSLTLFAAAGSYTTYVGTMSSTYIQYAEDIYNGLNTTEDYVFARVSQYVYVMYVGDITFADGRVDGTGGTVYTISQVYTEGYNNYLELTSKLDDSFVLVYGDDLIYGSIEGLPHFDDNSTEEVNLLYVIAFTLAAMFMLDIIRSVFFRSRK